MWFDPPETFRRKTDAERQFESESKGDETGKIQRWLDLAAQLFASDENPTPKAKRKAASESDVA